MGLTVANAMSSPAQPWPWPRGLPDFVQPAVEPMVYGAMTQAGAKVGWIRTGHHPQMA